MVVLIRAVIARFFKVLGFLFVFGVLAGLATFLEVVLDLLLQILNELLVELLRLLARQLHAIVALVVVGDAERALENRIDLLELRVALSLIVPLVYLVCDTLQESFVILEALVVEIVLGVTYI